MTLRAKPEETYKNIESTMKITKFTQMVKRIQSYLQIVIDISDGGPTVPPNAPIGCPILLFGKMTESNPYICVFREIFEYKCILWSEYHGFAGKPFEAKFAPDSWWSIFIQSDCDNLDKLESILDQLDDSNDGYSIAGMEQSYGVIYARTYKITELKYYIVFWNLFLSTLCNSLYDEEFPIIADLAYYFGFDEHMMRDWCRAVEYVLTGNRLSETCDLQCDTVEGARFFLHRD